MHTLELRKKQRAVKERLEPSKDLLAPVQRVERLADKEESMEQEMLTLAACVQLLKGFEAEARSDPADPMNMWFDLANAARAEAEADLSECDIKEVQEVPPELLTCEGRKS